MKIITANRLTDGVVVYLGSGDAWTERLDAAARFDDGDIDGVLAAMSARAREFADIYAITVEEDGRPAAREALRETIRQNGPTIRADLGRQAEAR
ncbi:MAG: DUF2849 domain-containing protein [Pseudomonadota bacterium]